MIVVPTNTTDTTVDLEELVRSVMQSDGFNWQSSREQLLHVFEIGLKKLGILSLTRGPVNVHLGGRAVLQVTVARKDY